jgi:hypothetical protein
MDKNAPEVDELIGLGFTRDEALAILESFEVLAEHLPEVGLD